MYIIIKSNLLNYTQIKFPQNLINSRLNIKSTSITNFANAALNSTNSPIVIVKQLV